MNNQSDNTMEKFTQTFNAMEANSTSCLKEKRLSAYNALKQQGWPTRKTENWKYTSLTTWMKASFNTNAPTTAKENVILSNLNLQPIESYKIVILNGKLLTSLSDADLPNSIKLYTLQDAITHIPEQIEAHFGKTIDHTRHPFANMNIALAAQGIVVHCATDTTLTKPLQLIYCSENNVETHFYELLILENNSTLEVIRQFESIDDTPCFTNHIEEVILYDHAKYHTYKLQHYNKHSYHIDGLHVHQNANTVFESFTLDMGGLLARTDIDVTFMSPDSTCHVNGYYQAKGTQHIDNHNQIDHIAPHCQSHETYKGTLDDKSRVVFNGKIIIHKDAQRTTTKQLNKNLLLSPYCEIDTKPELEIYADDVRASHGATSGQLDQEALFYLLSRGIPHTEAKQLLLQAFANDTFQLLSNASVRTWFMHYLHREETA